MYGNGIDAAGVCITVSAACNSDSYMTIRLSHFLTLYCWGHSGNVVVVVWACVFERMQLVNNHTTFIVTENCSNLLMCFSHHCAHYVALSSKSLTRPELWVACPSETPSVFPLRLWKMCLWLNVNHHWTCSSSARKWLSFCLILSPCCPYVNQDIGKQVRGYKKRYFLIEKPPTCKLDEGTYRLVSEPEGDIKPQVSLFACARVSAHVISLILQPENMQYNMLWLSDQHQQIILNYVYLSLCRIWSSPLRWPRWKATLKLSLRSLLPLNCLS